jgi:two-component system chemotaxis response regulator CheB
MHVLRSVIVVGASAGGLKAVTQLVSTIPANLDTAIFVVLHVARSSFGPTLVRHIQNVTSYECVLAADGLAIEKGHLYVALPDHHLIIKPDVMLVTKGAHENRWRPSIDVLFRSAAANFNSRAIGIILTGMLDDGTSGMGAIKSSGGVCIVQEPNEAEFEDMPQNVLNNVDVDYRLPIADMGYALQDLFSKPQVPEAVVPHEIQVEAGITERMSSSMDELKKLGERSNFSCPDCGGGLWEIKNDVIPRYRCYTGHVYTEKILLEKHAEGLEESLWVSIRMLEERKNLLLMMAHRSSKAGDTNLENENHKRADTIGVHIERLKKLMITLEEEGPEGSGHR